MHISWRKYNIRNPHTSTFTCRIMKNKSLTTWAVNHLTRNGFPNHKTSLHIYFGYIIFMNCNYQNKGRVPTPKWMLPDGFCAFTNTAYPGSDRIGIFYFLWFLTLMRKARNVIIKLPKVTNSVRIPMNIETISKAVIITR